MRSLCPCNQQYGNLDKTYTTAILANMPTRIGEISQGLRWRTIGNQRLLREGESVFSWNKPLPGYQMPRNQPWTHMIMADGLNYMCLYIYVTIIIKE